MIAIGLLILFQTPPDAAGALWRAVARSGRVVEQGESETKRIYPDAQIAPGPPPLLQFRYLEGKLRHRFGDTSLVLDDAGH